MQALVDVFFLHVNSRFGPQLVEITVFTLTLRSHVPLNGTLVKGVVVLYYCVSLLYLGHRGRKPLTQGVT